MMPRTKEVPKERFKIFKDKAGEFYTSMEDAFDRGNYDACVSNAVHCAICIVDALTVSRLGKKSSAQNHIEAALLLKETKTSDENEKARMLPRLHALLELKTLAEYEDRTMSKSEAEKAIGHCNKVYAFIKRELETNKVRSDG